MKLYFKMSLHCTIVYGVKSFCAVVITSQFYCIDVRVRLTGTSWNVDYMALCDFTGVSAQLTGTGSGAPSVTTIAARRHIRNSVDTERASTQTASRRDR